MTSDTLKDLLNDGGPAFPEACTRDGHPANVSSGMSLRDWFAGQFAMAAYEEGLKGYSHVCPETLSRAATTAYQFADALIKARGK